MLGFLQHLMFAFSLYTYSFYKEVELRAISFPYHIWVREQGLPEHCTRRHWPPSVHKPTDLRSLKSSSVRTEWPQRPGNMNSKLPRARQSGASLVCLVSGTADLLVAVTTYTCTHTPAAVPSLISSQCYSAKMLIQLVLGVSRVSQ